MDATPLEMILKLCEGTPSDPQRRTYCAVSRGYGRYYVDEIEYKVTPPTLYEFSSDIGDTIAIWSTSSFLNERTAHEIAFRIGERIGWYV